MRLGIRLIVYVFNTVIMYCTVEMLLIIVCVFAAGDPHYQGNASECQGAHCAFNQQ